MNILIIHDRSDVRSEIADLCSDTLNGSCLIEQAGDYVSGRNALVARTFDLAIIDLTLPHIEGKFDPNYDTAHELIQEIVESSAIYAPGDLVGISRDAKAASLLQGDIGSHLMVIIEETPDGQWKEQLEDRINYVRRSRHSRQLSLHAHYDYDACILTALDKEMEPYRDNFEMQEDGYFKGAYKFLYKDGAGVTRRGIVCSIGRAGPARAASKTQSLLIWYRPKLLLMSGFCGSIKSDLRLGDIAIFETVFDWDYGKWESRGYFRQEFLARPEPISIRELEIHDFARRIVTEGIPEFQELVARAKRLSPKIGNSIAVRLVPAASGSAVVANPRIVRRIRGLNESIGAVDMESYGVYLAAGMTPGPRPDFLVVKSVADYCDVKKTDDFQAGCSLLSAEVVLHILKKYIRNETNGR